MKKLFIPLLAALLFLGGCTAKDIPADSAEIRLSDSGIEVTGAAEGAVRIANDIIYYEAGHDFTYGEGTEADGHTAEEAAAHTVVHITKPGAYTLSGTLSKGQIAVDLGSDAKEDPNAVVTLILNGVDITCEVAPAIIFYNVYECGNPDTPSKDVDTSAAGANIILADGSENTVSGSYVARIYKPDSVVLSDDGSEVADAKKLHKYDGAFYSRMSMNIDGGKKGTGLLTIVAENEGLDSELHLTINGGNIRILSGNDGINTNEDGISVTTINGGTLDIRVTGETGEGDGIDSNGWLVINGGTVTAQACSFSADAGIDSDMGIHINGGTVIATGHMLDHIEEGGQNYAVFTFAQTDNIAVTLRNEQDTGILDTAPENDYSILVFSSQDLKPGIHTLWSGSVQLAGQRVNGSDKPGGGMMPQGPQPPDGSRPAEPPAGESHFGDREPPSGGERPPHGDNPFGGQPGSFTPGSALSAGFEIQNGGNLFQFVSPVA